nr:succinate dehydrogenase cytochrome subunit 4 [Gnetum hainanense]
MLPRCISLGFGSFCSVQLIAYLPVEEEGQKKSYTNTTKTKDMRGHRQLCGFRNGCSGSERTGLFRRITAAPPLPCLLISKVFSTFPPYILIFRHINVGIEEIMADHVHQGMTRNWIFIYLGSFLFIVIKDVFLSSAP